MKQTESFLLTSYLHRRLAEDRVALALDDAARDTMLCGTGICRIHADGSIEHVSRTTVINWWGLDTIPPQIHVPPAALRARLLESTSLAMPHGENQ